MNKKLFALASAFGLSIASGVVTTHAEEMSEAKVRDIVKQELKGNKSSGSSVFGSGDSFEMHGHLQMEYENEGSDGGRGGNSTFDNQYFTMWFGYNFRDDWTAVAEIEYEHGGTPSQGGKLEVDNAYANWDILSDGSLQFRAGKFYTPFGIERKSYAGPSNKLVTRPQVFQRIWPGTYSGIGFMLHGDVPVTDSNTFKYEVAIVNGLGGDASDGIRDMRQDRDNNDNKALTGRLAFNSKIGDDLEIEVGASHYTGKWNSHLGYIAANKLDMKYWGYDVLVNYQGFQFKMEQITQSVEMGEGAVGAGSVRNFRRGGYYMQGAYKQEIDKTYLKFLEYVVRYNYKDENSTVDNTADETEWALGLTWGIFDDVKIKAERQFNHERHGGSLSNDAWYGQLSVAF